MAVPGSVRQRQYRERLQAAGRVERAATRRLAVFCWCETKIVHVPARDVIEGRTGTCGRRNCHALRRGGVYP